MSIKSSLLVLLLCISFCASHARHHRVISREEPEEKYDLPNKNKEKTSHAKTQVTTKLKPSSPKQGTTPRVDDKDQDNHYKAMSPEAQKEMKKHKGVGETSSPPQPHVQPPLSVSTSWRLPRGIPLGQNQPGFNLDYAPPETHPPVNN